MILKIVLDQHDRGMIWIICLLLIFALISWLDAKRRN